MRERCASTSEPVVLKNPPIISYRSEVILVLRLRFIGTISGGAVVVVSLKPPRIVIVVTCHETTSVYVCGLTVSVCVVESKIEALIPNRGILYGRLT